MENAPVVQEFIELAELDAASRKERLVVDAVTRKLSDMGFTVREDDTAEKVGGEAGNVCAYLEGSAKGSVLFAAHLDRVNNGDQAAIQGRLSGFGWNDRFGSR